MKPVIIGDATLYLGDCLEILPFLGPVDAVVTDPPYGIAHPCNFKGRGRGNLAECNDYPDVIGDDEPFDPAPILALGVPTVLWGGDHITGLPVAPGWLVWDKKRPDDLDQSTCELAWTNCVKGTRRFSHLWNGMMRESEHGENYHPTQKPVALFSWILALRWLPHIRNVILDPYMGSGPCGVACIRGGRSYIGIEIEPRYFDIACERISREYAQLKLFPPVEKRDTVQEELGI
jgi:site-specific DNA-methyltransferase (adenine-specific)